MRGWGDRPVIKKRVWRGLGFPRGFDAEKFTSRKMTQLQCGVPGYEISYHRPKRFKGFCEPDSPIRHRETIVAIRTGGELVGYLEIEEFDLTDAVDNEDLWEWLDAESAYHGELATALCAEWEDVEGDVCGYGPIVHFDNVWIRSDHARGGLWKPVAAIVFENLFPKRSITAFKPFPLEYEGLDEIAHVGLERRLAAATRMATRAMTSYKLPTDGTTGWYWSPRPGLADILLRNSESKNLPRWKSGDPATIYWADLKSDKPANDR